MEKLNWGMRACGVLLLWAATAVALPAQTFTTIYSFCAQTNCTDGQLPVAGLVQGTDGNLYSTASSAGSGGYGTVFKLSTDGAFTTLFSFYRGDGATPYAALAQGTDGNFFGSTTVGGKKTMSTKRNCGSPRCGTLFEITPDGTLTSLHQFQDQADGSDPYGALVQGVDGDFYGTARGVSSEPETGRVFKISADGKLTALHNFCAQGSCVDGDQPYAGLALGADGNFYGTTYTGGANQNSYCFTGCGTIFKITPGGTFTIIYDFCSKPNCTDGTVPYSGLLQGRDGNFYGTTYGGGANNFGTVFSITPGGALTTLYSFCSQTNCADGDHPTGGLVQAVSIDGNFYGTTNGGGIQTGTICEELNGCGTIFKVTSTGTLTTVYTFCSQSDCTDGAGPYAGLMQDTSGKFYGTTEYGGANNNGSDGCAFGCGKVFALSVGLGPFVKTLPTIGKVGTAVKILGTNLTGATSVTFNGTAATFTVISRSFIKTSVPLGATTGTVQVVTPGGALSSNVPFTVN
jgi:uncharacterized repeat protein (TIGR03803 family)